MVALLTSEDTEQPASPTPQLCSSLGQPPRPLSSAPQFCSSLLMRGSRNKARFSNAYRDDSHHRPQP
ncbi:hypothetical protein LEMLEM_LOCUS7775 [Lemmus lemmus]